MENNVFMFYLFSATILVFSVLAVTSRRILRAAVFLLFALVATSGFYFMTEISVSGRGSAFTLCRWYCCADHFLYPAYPSYQS